MWCLPFVRLTVRFTAGTILKIWPNFWLFWKDGRGTTQDWLRLRSIQSDWSNVLNWTKHEMNCNKRHNTFHLCRFEHTFRFSFLDLETFLTKILCSKFQLLMTASQRRKPTQTAAKILLLCLRLWLLSASDCNTDGDDGDEMSVLVWCEVWQTSHLLTRPCCCCCCCWRAVRRSVNGWDEMMCLLFIRWLWLSIRGPSDWLRSALSENELPADCRRRRQITGRRRHTAKSARHFLLLLLQRAQYNIRVAATWQSINYSINQNTFT